MLRHQRAQVMLGVVARRELEESLAGLLRRPDRRPLGQLRRPVDARQHPGRLDACQLGGGGQIEIRRRVTVPLQERGRDIRRDLALDRARHDVGLVLPRGDQRDLARIEDRGDAHRDRLARYVVLAEEIGGRVLAGDRVEDRETGARILRRPRLIEADVPTLADPQQLEVDPPRLGDGSLVGVAVLGEPLARHAAIGDVHVLRPDVDVREQILPHVAPIAVRAVRRHGIVLVEVERDDARQIDLARLVTADQLAVDTQRRAAGGEPQHAPPLGRRLSRDHLGDAVGEQHGEIVVVGHHDRGNALAVARTFDQARRSAPRGAARSGRARDAGVVGRHLVSSLLAGQPSIEIEGKNTSGRDRGQSQTARLLDGPCSLSHM